MRREDFGERCWGQVVRSPRDYWYFVPRSLPPALDSTWELTSRLSEADRALSVLAGTARNLPNPHLLIGSFVRREAVLSSRIEGTEASLSDLFFFEAARVAPKQGGSLVADVREVANYVRALEHGLARLAEFPVSLRLIREMHAILLDGVRGERLTPGEFRRSQNWIGPAGCGLSDATYVPPAVPEMTEALSDLEKFLHAKTRFPPLVRLAMAHYQFEAIHPFLDGNGRIGRLLVSLLLCRDGLLREPLLYLSDFLERNREEYYERLLAVSRAGAWSSWIEFFLRGVAEQSQDAVWRAGRLLELWREHRRRFEAARSSSLVLRLVDHLFESPVITIPRAARLLGVTQRSASLIVAKLQKNGILAESSGRERNRVFVAARILAVIEADQGGARSAPTNPGRG